MEGGKEGGTVGGTVGGAEGGMEGGEERGMEGGAVGRMEGDGGWRQKAAPLRRQGGCGEAEGHFRMRGPTGAGVLQRGASAGLLQRGASAGLLQRDCFSGVASAGCFSGIASAGLLHDEACGAAGAVGKDDAEHIHTGGGRGRDVSRSGGRGRDVSRSGGSGDVADASDEFAGGIIDSGFAHGGTDGELHGLTRTHGVGRERKTEVSGLIERSGAAARGEGELERYLACAAVGRRFLDEELASLGKHIGGDDGLVATDGIDVGVGRTAVLTLDGLFLDSLAAEGDGIVDIARSVIHVEACEQRVFAGLNHIGGDDKSVFVVPSGIFANERLLLDGLYTIDMHVVDTEGGSGSVRGSVYECDADILSGIGIERSREGVPLTVANEFGEHGGTECLPSSPVIGADSEVECALHGLRRGGVGTVEIELVGESCVGRNGYLRRDEPSLMLVLVDVGEAVVWGSGADTPGVDIVACSHEWSRECGFASRYLCEGAFGAFEIPAAGIHTHTGGSGSEGLVEGRRQHVAECEEGDGVGPDGGGIAIDGLYLHGVVLTRGEPSDGVGIVGNTDRIGVVDADVPSVFGSRRQPGEQCRGLGDIAYGDVLRLHIGAEFGELDVVDEECPARVGSLDGKHLAVACIGIEAEVDIDIGNGRVGVILRLDGDGLQLLEGVGIVGIGHHSDNSRSGGGTGDTATEGEACAETELADSSLHRREDEQFVLGHGEGSNCDVVVGEGDGMRPLGAQGRFGRLPGCPASVREAEAFVELLTEWQFGRRARRSEGQFYKFGRLTVLADAADIE